MPLQQEGAECLSICTLQFGRDFFYGKFPRKRIGTGDPVVWPPLSRHLAPLQFFFWGYIKDAVHVPSVPPFTVKTAMLTNVWNELENRHGTCRATHGAFTEHL